MIHRAWLKRIGSATIISSKSIKRVIEANVEIPRSRSQIDVPQLNAKHEGSIGSGEVERKRIVGVTGQRAGRDDVLVEGSDDFVVEKCNEEDDECH